MTENDSNARSGVGVRIRKWSTSSSPAAWVDIDEVTNIEGPSMERDMIEITHFGYTNGFRGYIPGFKDGGTVKLSMNYTRASLDSFVEDFESDDPGNYEIYIPDADETSVTFEGYVQMYPLTIPVDKQITMEVTIKVTGKPEVNDGLESSAPA